MANDKGRGLTLIVGVAKPKPHGAMPPLDTPEQRRRHAADVEASFTGRPQPNGTYDAEGDSGRVSAETAGYMELDGAQKTGDCDLVDVPGGVSEERGCCNLFDPRPGASEFECGQCLHYHAGTESQPQSQLPEQE